jgi:hypothetical protein
MKKLEFIETDYKNRFNRRIWLEERRRDLLHYFDSRNITNGTIGKEPYWCVVPRTSIWQIPSMGTPGFDGWFGIAGDHPTDVVPLNYFSGEPRVILEHFVNKWLRAAERLKQGEDYGDFRIEHIEERPTIGELIEDRATRLKMWVEAEELWHNVVPLQPLHIDNSDESDDDSETPSEPIE